MKKTNNRPIPDSIFPFPQIKNKIKYSRIRNLIECIHSIRFDCPKLLKGIPSNIDIQTSYRTHIQSMIISKRVLLLKFWVHISTARKFINYSQWVLHSLYSLSSWIFKLVRVRPVLVDDEKTTTILKSTQTTSSLLNLLIALVNVTLDWIVGWLTSSSINSKFKRISNFFHFDLLPFHFSRSLLVCWNVKMRKCEVFFFWKAAKNLSFPMSPHVLLSETWC